MNKDDQYFVESRSNQFHSPITTADKQSEKERKRRHDVLSSRTTYISALSSTAPD